MEKSVPKEVLAALPPLTVAPEPLRLQIDAPKAANVEESFRVRVCLVNGSAKPVVAIVPAPLNHNLGANFQGALWLGARRVPTKWAGRWTGQWSLPQEYKAEAFATIAPGGRIPVESIEFAQEYAAGIEPGLGEVEMARLKPIAEGRYVYRAEWQVQPDLSRTSAFMTRAGLGPTKMTPEAEKLYAVAWKGTLRAEAPITIRSKSAEE